MWSIIIRLPRLDCSFVAFESRYFSALVLEANERRYSHSSRAVSNRGLRSQMTELQAVGSSVTSEPRARTLRAEGSHRASLLRTCEEVPRCLGARGSPDEGYDSRVCAAMFIRLRALMPGSSIRSPRPACQPRPSCQRQGRRSQRSLALVPSSNSLAA